MNFIPPIRYPEILLRLADYPGAAPALATLEYFEEHPELVGPYEIRVILGAEEHLKWCSAHQRGELGGEVVAKGGEVLAPGSRGGKWHRTEEGNIDYREKTGKKPRFVLTADPVKKKRGYQVTPPVIASADLVAHAPDADHRPLPDSPFVVSCGMGKDSCAMLIEMYNRGIRPTAITFADTGGEMPETYAYIPIFKEWLRKVGFPPVVTVRYKGTGRYETLEDNCIANETVPGVVMGRKNCSEKYKTEPQRLWTRDQQWALDAWRAQKPVLRAIGFEAGEEYRSARTYAAKKSPGEVTWFPLQDWNLTRPELNRIFAGAGLPVAEKSACFFCPVSHPPEVIELARKHPDLAARAVAMEDVARSGKQPLRGPVGLSWDFSWRKLLEKHNPGVLQLVEDMPDERRFGTIVHFGSGASSKAEFEGYMLAKAAAGVEIHTLGETTKHDLAEYALKQGRTFVDSGAFPLFRRQEKARKEGKPIPPPLDWDDVLDRYDDLLQTVGEHTMEKVKQGQKKKWHTAWKRLYMVAPDVIGKQAESLALQRKYASRIRGYIQGSTIRDDKWRWEKRIAEAAAAGKRTPTKPLKWQPVVGVRMLVPIQKGPLRPSQVYADLVGVLGTDDFSVAVPSNEEAFTEDDLADLARAQPRGIHLLGIGPKAGREYARKVAIIRQHSPATSITSDSNRLRAWVGEGRPLTEAVNARWPLEQLAAYGPMEGYNDPHVWRDPEVRKFADYLGVQVGHVKRAMASEESFGAYLNSIRDDYEGADRGIVDDAIRSAFLRELNVRPHIRSEEIAHLIEREEAAARIHEPSPQLKLFGKAAGYGIPLGGLRAQLLSEKERVLRDLWYLQNEDLLVTPDSSLLAARASTLRQRLLELERELGRFQ